jgi:hypothetical protein
VRRHKRRLLRWERYWDHYMFPGYVATPGLMRAWNSYAHAVDMRSSKELARQFAEGERLYKEGMQ